MKSIPWSALERGRRLALLGPIAAAAVLALVSACEDGTQATATLPAPDTVAAEPVSSSSIRLTWTIPGDKSVVSYKIERRVNFEGEFQTLKEVPLSQLQIAGGKAQTMDSGLQPETFYGYRVRSLGRLGAFSTASTIAGARTAPKPGIRVLTQSLTSAPDVDGYTIRVTGPEARSTAIGADDSKVLNALPAGTYQVGIEGLDARCTLEGAPSRTVTLTDSGLETINEVLFRVSCRDPNRGRVVAVLVSTGLIPTTSYQVLLSGVPTAGGGVSRQGAAAAARAPGSPVLFDDLQPGSYEVEVKGIDPTRCQAKGPAIVRGIQVKALSTDTVRFEVGCGSGPANANANVLGRWVNASGSAVNLVRPGSVVRLQLCATIDADAFNAQVHFSPTILKLDSIRNLDSGAPQGVHPDCRGTTDLLDDAFTANPFTDRVTFQVIRIETQPSVGKVGIAEIFFKTLGEGPEYVGLDEINLAAGASTPTAVVAVDSLVVTNAVNEPPIAKPGGPYVVTVGDTLKPSGSASSDPDGTIARYDWSWGDGTDAANGGATPKKLYAAAGSFKLKLTVTDNKGAAATDSTTVTVSPAGPAIDAKAGGAYVGEPATAISFNGGGSTTRKGGPLAFAWTFGDGATSATGPTTTHAYDTAGVYRVILAVTDSSGLSDADTTSATVRVKGVTFALKNDFLYDTAFASEKVTLKVTINPDKALDQVGAVIKWDSTTLRIDSARAGPFATRSFQTTPANKGTFELAAAANTAAAAGVTSDVARLYFTMLTVTATKGVVTQTSNLFFRNGSTRLDLNGLSIVEDTLLAINGPPNASPQARANGPYTGYVNQPVALSASGSADSDGTIVSYAWTFGDGSNGTGPAVNHPYTTAGTFTAKLTVTDDRGATAGDSATVTIAANAAPVAKANGPYAGRVGELISFSASGSLDTDGSIVSYAWSFSDGISATGPAPQRAFHRLGPVTATLVVTDDKGASGAAQAMVAVSEPPNYAVKAAWLNSPSSTPAQGVRSTYDNLPGTAGPGDVVGLDLSTKPNVGVVKVQTRVTWPAGTLRYDSAQKGTPFTTTFTTARPVAGTLDLVAEAPTALSTTAETQVARLFFTVTGLEGDSVVVVPSNVTLNAAGGAAAGDTLALLTSMLRIREGGPNKLPTAEAGGPYTGTTTSPVHFNGSGTDSDGFIIRYDWDFGDGTRVSNLGPAPTHQYTQAGSYAVALTVVDNNRASGTDLAVATITVGTPNQAPVARAGGPYSGVPNTPLAFSGSTSSDADGTIARYDWTWGDGQTSANAGATPSHTYAAVGSYTVTLVVTDNLGATGQATATATVAAAGSNQPPVAEANGPYTGTAGAAITFNSTGSNDPAGGSITKYDWVWGDGQSSLNGGASPTHAYAAAGTYTVRLTVTDNGTPGLTAVDSATVTVSAGGGGGGAVGNIRVRWMSSAGTPITTATVGQTVKAQVCSPLNLEAGDVKLSFSSKLTYGSIVELNSGGTGVHADCAGTTDNLKDFFTTNAVPGAVSISVINQNGTPSTGNVGIAEITFTVASAGTETVSLSDFNLDPVGGGADPATPDVNVTPLVITAPE